MDMKYTILLFGTVLFDAKHRMGVSQEGRDEQA